MGDETVCVGHAKNIWDGKSAKHPAITQSPSSVILAVRLSFSGKRSIDLRRSSPANHDRFRAYLAK